MPIKVLHFLYNSSGSRQRTLKVCKPLSRKWGFCRPQMMNKKYRKQFARIKETEYTTSGLRAWKGRSERFPFVFALIRNLGTALTAEKTLWTCPENDNYDEWWSEWSLISDQPGPNLMMMMIDLYRPQCPLHLLDCKVQTGQRTLLKREMMTMMSFFILKGIDFICPFGTSLKTDVLLTE